MEELLGTLEEFMVELDEKSLTDHEPGPRHKLLFKNNPLEVKESMALVETAS